MDSPFIGSPQPADDAMDDQRQGAGGHATPTSVAIPNLPDEVAIPTLPDEVRNEGPNAPPAINLPDTVMGEDGSAGANASPGTSAEPTRGSPTASMAEDFREIDTGAATDDDDDNYNPLLSQVSALVNPDSEEADLAALLHEHPPGLVAIISNFTALLGGVFTPKKILCATFALGGSLSQEPKFDAYKHEHGLKVMEHASEAIESGRVRGSIWAMRGLSRMNNEELTQLFTESLRCDTDIEVRVFGSAELPLLVKINFPRADEEYLRLNSFMATVHGRDFQHVVAWAKSWPSHALAQITDLYLNGCALEDQAHLSDIGNLIKAGVREQAIWYKAKVVRPKDTGAIPHTGFSRLSATKANLNSRTTPEVKSPLAATAPFETPSTSNTTPAAGSSGGALGKRAIDDDGRQGSTPGSPMPDGKRRKTVDGKIDIFESFGGGFGQDDDDAEDEVL